MTETVVIFGATGGTGRQLIEQALAAGYRVRAFARNPASISNTHEHLDVVKGDVFDPATIDPALDRADAVLCALGALPWGSPPVCSVGTRNIIESMRRHGVRRLVCETAFGLGTTWTELPLFGRIFARFIIRKYLDDKIVQENLIRDSDLAWVIVRPTRLTNGPLTRQYRSGTNLSFTRSPKISRANVAAFMIEQLREPTFLRQAVTVTE